jgi:hypothetical protein
VPWQSLRWRVIWVLIGELRRKTGKPDTGARGGWVMGHATTRHDAPVPPARHGEHCRGSRPSRWSVGWPRLSSRPPSFRDFPGRTSPGRTRSSRIQLARAGGCSASPAGSADERRACKRVNAVRPAARRVKGDFVACVPSGYTRDSRVIPGTDTWRADGGQLDPEHVCVEDEGSSTEVNSTETVVRFTHRRR